MKIKNYQKLMIISMGFMILSVFISIINSNLFYLSIIDKALKLISMTLLFIAIFINVKSTKKVKGNVISVKEKVLLCGLIIASLIILFAIVIYSYNLM